MDQLAILLDAPTLTQGATQSLHPVAKLGRYKDPRYGKFAITRADVASWDKNLRTVQNGRVAIDYDHLAEEQGGSTKAAGWITGLRLMTGRQLAEQIPGYAPGVDAASEYAVASIDWTPEGADSVRAGYWLYVSPTFVGKYRDEQHVDHGPALIGTALTNRPFLRSGMPAISLASASADDLPAAVADDGEEPRDSRAMKKLAIALGLAEDADEDAILTALQAAKTPDAEALKLKLKEDGNVILTEAEHKALTVKADAADDTKGKVILTQEEHAALKGDAKLGADAHEQLRKLTFDRAYERSLGEGRLDSAKETREKWSKRYDDSPELSLELLAELPVIASTSPAGGKADDGELPGQPAGVDEDRAALTARALSIQAEKKIPFVQAAQMAEKELAHAS